MTATQALIKEVCTNKQYIYVEDGRLFPEELRVSGPLKIFPFLNEKTNKTGLLMVAKKFSPYFLDILNETYKTIIYCPQKTPPFLKETIRGIQVNLDTLFKHRKYNAIQENGFVMQETGFFAKGRQVYSLEGTRHSFFIIKNPEKFGLTKEEIEDLYKQYGESLSQEGKAREALIKKVAQTGWVRIRYYPRKEYWSIQADDTKKRMDTIVNFIFWALDKKLMDTHDGITVLGYNNTEDIYQYPAYNGGVDAFIKDILSA